MARIRMGSDRDTPYISCPDTDAGDNTFAVVINGNAMLSSSGQSYPDGATVFVNPESKIANGDNVIASTDDGGLVFRVYINEGGKAFLKPLNIQYPVISEGFLLIGKAVGMWIPC